MIHGIDKYFSTVGLERLTPTTDAWGNKIDSWVAVPNIKGLIRQLNKSGEEQYTSDKKNINTTHRMYCRKNDVRINDRVVFMARKYDVVAVNDVMNFEELYQVELVLRES